MLSRMNSVLVVVLAVLSMTAGFTTVARADTLYVHWRSTSPGGGWAYDVATGNSITNPPFAPIAAVAQGMAISPLDGLLYAVTTGNKIIKKYNPATGADLGTLATMPGTTRGLVFDSAGNLYAGLGYSTVKDVAKIKPDGTFTANWGAGQVGGANDLEIFGNTLYGSVGTGVVKWDLTTGAPLGNHATGIQVDGIAFAPDGRMFTGHCSGESTVRTVREWDTTYLFANSKIIISEPWTGSYVNDVDYWNGYVYAAYNKYVYRYDLSSQTSTQFITGNTTYTGVSGFLAIAIPEPGTLALLGIGLVGLLCYAWRKRK